MVFRRYRSKGGRDKLVRPSSRVELKLRRQLERRAADAAVAVNVGIVGTGERGRDRVPAGGGLVVLAVAIHELVYRIGRKRRAERVAKPRRPRRPGTHGVRADKGAVRELRNGRLARFGSRAFVVRRTGLVRGHRAQAVRGAVAVELARDHDDVLQAAHVARELGLVGVANLARGAVAVPDARNEVARGRVRRIASVRARLAEVDVRDDVVIGVERPVRQDLREDFLRGRLRVLRVGDGVHVRVDGPGIGDVRGRDVRGVAVRDRLVTVYRRARRGSSGESLRDVPGGRGEVRRIRKHADADGVGSALHFEDQVLDDVGRV